MKIAKLFIGIVFFIFIYSCYNNENKAGNTDLKSNQAQPIAKDIKDTLTLFKDFNELNTEIRDMTVQKDTAIVKFKKLLVQIKSYYYSHQNN